MRLRQIALVGADLAAAEADIRAILGLDYAYDDPGVGEFGLRNAVFPIGETFLEVVSPKQAGTTAGRLLEKRGGDGWRTELPDGGEIRFVVSKDGRGEGLGRFDVAVRDPDAVRAAAKARGRLGEGGDVILSGTRVRLAQS